MRWIGYVAAILWWSGIARSLSSMNRGYKISPKPCRVTGQPSVEGTCMFVWECIKSEGTHVGVCVDTFMFGSCCVHNATSNSIGSSASSSHLSHKQQTSLSGSGRPAARPSLAEALAGPDLTTTSLMTTTTPTTTTSRTTTITISLPRPASTAIHGSAGPVSTSHITASQAGSQAHHTSLATTRQPVRPSSSAAASRPLLQKRPHSKPNNSPEQDYHDHQQQQQQQQQQHHHHHQQQQQQQQQYHHDNTSQITRRPQSGLNQGYHEKRPEEDRHHSSGHHHHHHHHHQGFKDKVSSSHNTLLVRLPNKNGNGNSHQQQQHQQHQQASSSKNQVQRPHHRPGYGPRPYPESRPEEDSKTDEQAQDLSVQETVHRPSINLVDDDEATDKLSNPSLNFIHTERPQWATKPVSSSNGRPTASEPYSKPYFSVKTTSTTTSTTTTHRPYHGGHGHGHGHGHSVMLVTPAATSYYGGLHQSTSAAGSVPQTAHWQVTTEPAFVTRHKPGSSGASSSLRPEGGGSSWPPQQHKPQQQQHHKPQWTDPQRPSFKPTEPQENNVYQKPHSAHYITTSYLETPTKPRPTKKPTTTTTSTTSTTTTSTTTTSTTTPRPATSTHHPTTSSSSTAETLTESTSPARTGSVLTVPAAPENSDMSCGVPALFPGPETRIVGGKEAAFGKWPWQVSVRRTSFFGFSSTHRCGGAVLNENWIATAGHCVDDLLTSQIRIRVGEYDFSSVQERLPYVERGITKKVVHPKYNFFTFEYDLALVRLEKPLVFAPHISPICLPASDELLIGENATVTGWGRLSEGGTLPSVLQEVSVPIVSNDRCKSMFLRAGRHEFIPEIFLCAGFETGGQDSCQGDSGGPLQVRGKDGRYFLAGIISWGIGCAEANLPGVCTRISKFVPWILKNVT